jgi:phage-related protein
MDRKIRTLVRERKAVAEKARRLLQAAVVEAYGRPGVYVTMAQVMKRSNVSDTDEYQTIAKHLEKEGWIAEADPDYGVFVLTLEGIDEATH